MNKRAAPAAPNSRQMFALRCRLIEPARPIGHGGPRNALQIDRLGPAGPRPCQVETLVGGPASTTAAGQVDVAGQGDVDPSTTRAVARVRDADRGGADTRCCGHGWHGVRRLVARASTFITSIGDHPVGSSRED